MKKFIIGFLAGAVLFGSLATIAATGLRDVSIADAVSLWVHGNRIETDIIHAVRYDNPHGFGRNYVSARDLAEALGYYVDWCGDTNRILVSRYRQTVTPPPAQAQQRRVDPALTEISWIFNTNPANRIAFHTNGTGVRLVSGHLIEFSWWIDDRGNLVIYHAAWIERHGLVEIENVARYEYWSYTVAGNSLSKTDMNPPFMSVHFTREIPLVAETPPVLSQIDFNLVSGWTWNIDSTYSYVFNSDGFGHRGFFPEFELFEWQVTEPGLLLIHTDTMTEIWDYTIINDVLTIESRQIPDLIFSYLRAAG